MKNYLFQILDCITLKVWATGSLRILANPCKFASHLCKKIKINCFLYKFAFAGKINSPQIVFYLISNFCYYLTQPSVQCTTWCTLYSVKTSSINFRELAPTVNSINETLKSICKVSADNKMMLPFPLNGTVSQDL